MTETACLCAIVCGVFALGVGVGATALPRVHRDPPAARPPAGGGKHVQPGWVWLQECPRPTLARRLARVAELAAGVAAAGRAGLAADPRWLDEMIRHRDAVAAQAEEL